MSANLNGFSPKGKSTGKHFFPFDRKVNRTHLRDLWLYWENTKYSRKLASVLRNHKKTWWKSTLLQSSIFIIYKPIFQNIRQTFLFGFLSQCLFISYICFLPSVMQTCRTPRVVLSLHLGLWDVERYCRMRHRI